MEPTKVTDPSERGAQDPTRAHGAEESIAEQFTAPGVAHVARRTDREAVFDLRDVGVAYSGDPAVRQMTFPIYNKEITAFIGPSGCGKSTLIRCLNRMND